MKIKFQYVPLGRGKLAVYLGSEIGRGARPQRIGVIHYRDGKRPKGPVGFQYLPDGQRTGGEVFQRLTACKRSLEDSGERAKNTAEREIKKAHAVGVKHSKRDEWKPAFLVKGMNPKDWR